ncbi:hypothetical protein LEP1GSC161_2159 [Leptospira santarosai str. CBC1416]|uniref:Uncharacterized protein n=1 Tax=Leptospira santarosai str. CBC1416 TaxID=1193059 RepID=M6VM18_9LEPT|nr:hypothetical protein LEP1GSC161_2159 [Leptospira santarosai str. CBC1416]
MKLIVSPYGSKQNAGSLQSKDERPNSANAFLWIGAQEARH